MKVEENSKFIAFLVWAFVTLFYCYQYVLRPLPNIVMPEIMSKYGIGSKEFGSYAGIYYIGYIIAHIPLGLLLTRFGAKLVLPICIALTAVGIAPLIYFDSWEAVFIGRVLTGVGASASAIAALQLFRILFPAHFSMMVGLMVSFGLLTVVYAGAPISGIIKSVGMDLTINTLMACGLILALITYLVLPKSAEEVSHSDVWTDIKAVLLNPKLLVTGILAGFMVGPLEGFADAWGSAYLITVYGLSKATADAITLSIFGGMCIGCLVLPYIADKTRMYFGVTIFSGIAMILCFTYILGGQASETALYYACIVTGIFCAYQVVIIPKMATFVSEERSGMAAAIANMLVMAFGWVFHNYIGMSLDKSWDGGEAINGVKVYSAEAFNNSISIIPAAMGVAIVGLTVIAMANVVHARIISQRAKAL